MRPPHPPPHPSYLSAAGREELPALTGLRMLAALAVALWHAGHFMPAMPWPFHHFYLGVDLFFMLSGFIIAHVYWRDFERPSPQRYLRFVALRLARLWPAHIAMVLAFLLMFVAVTQLRGETLNLEPVRTELFLHLFLAHNWGFIPRTMVNFPTWSVSAEFLAYLLFPLQVALFRRLHSPWTLALAVPAALLLCWLLMGAWLGLPLGTAAPVANIRVLCEFAMGVALWRLWRDGRFAGLPWTAIVFACLAGMGVLALTPTWHVFDYLIVLLMAPVLLGLAHSTGLPARLLSSRPAVYLGEISYSIYLAHALIIAAVRPLLPHLDGYLDGRRQGWDIVALSLALTLVGGALLFHLVEKPARQWLRARIDRHLPALRAAATA
ncbi:MAG: acyltransferase family protein [Reyranellaceae bacterium]